MILLLSFALVVICFAPKYLWDKYWTCKTKESLGLNEKDFECCPVCHSEKIKTGYSSVSVDIICNKCGAQMSQKASINYNAVEKLKSSWNMRVPKGERKLDNETGLLSCPCCNDAVELRDPYLYYNYCSIISKCGLKIKSDEAEINECVKDSFIAQWNMEL